MTEEKQIRVTRKVDASPETLFALLSRPSRHPEIDSTNMLQGIEGPDVPISAVGDQFVMNMNNPILGQYQVKITVREFDENRLITWGGNLYPEDAYRDKVGDMKLTGHTFTWALEPDGSGTEVALTYDWSGVTDEQFRNMFPMISEEQLSDSVERAAAAAG
ncbi:polyketide cyclase/dehydrase/lipid transport protein [Actinomycetospora cinnamomea]|uniref:Polyketide cyclase/dehydrase/lipid transport protein n=2 Tax=Actinomycetospora cinnamomea TaxID=663609 RepID=A0A2U1FFQ5_9PSEU|nr:polyketide cyclase/dehydrase/lipid transport protein [Actinomycetospora cinnamomea]